MALLLCQVCGEEVGLGGQLLPTGPLCVNCVDPNAQEPVAPQLPTTTTNDIEAPRAADIPIPGQGEENKGESDASAPGDRAASFRFRRPERACDMSIEVEEWIYGIGCEKQRLGIGYAQQWLVSTPHQLDICAIQFLDATSSNWKLVERFALVLEWRESDDQMTPNRDVGRLFHGSRQVALSEALGLARAEARRLGAIGPIGFRPARSIEGAR